MYIKQLKNKDMSMTKDFYWEQICEGQAEAKLAEELDKVYQMELEEEKMFEDMAERQKFFDIYEVTNTYPM